MSTIHIQHIGALKDTGVLPINRVTLILGPQGVGKSTLMKILCYCRWVEKMIMKDASQRKWHTSYPHFYKGLSTFHRLSESFFTEQSHLVYNGDYIQIEWSWGGDAKITKRTKADAKRRHNPKLAFIPAERNLVSAVQNIDRSYRSDFRDVLFNFILELEEAKRSYNDVDHKLFLSITPHLYYYNQEGQDLIWHEKLGRPLSAFYAASGIQSAFPIDVVSSYLYGRVGQQITMSTSEIKAFLFGLLGAEEKIPGDIKERLIRSENQLKYSSMALYIEEPEQNLFPESQRNLILRLLQLISKVKEKELKSDGAPYASNLVFTTHSPYLLSVINTQFAVARARKYLAEKIEDKSASEDDRAAYQERLNRLNRLQKEKGVGQIDLSIDEYAAYFVDTDGKVKNLIDSEFPMVSGIELDGVSEWVEDYTDEVYQIAYEKLNLENGKEAEEASYL